MLVVLDPTLELISHEDVDAIAGLESVLVSSYNGDHFLTSSFTTARTLLRLPLSLKGQASLRRLRANISNHGHLPYDESFVIFITKGGEPQKSGPRKWQLPVTTFRNRPFPSSIVLGENMLDAEAYIFCAQQARAKHKIREHCRGFPDAGGGSQTSVKLRQYLHDENGFCFCITDGDYQEPRSPKSTVTSACESLARSSRWPAFATDFKARSVENILPLSLLEDSYEKALPPESLHKFKEVADADPETAIFIDAKVGMKFCSFKKMADGTSKKNFWETKFHKLGLKPRIDALLAEPPECAEDKCGKCTLIEGLGPSTLKQAVEYFKKNSQHRLAQRVNKESIWCDLGTSVFHWTMADKPELS